MAVYVTRDIFQIHQVVSIAARDTSVALASRITAAEAAEAVEPVI